MVDRWDEFSERLRDVETREVHFAGSGDPNGVVSAAMGAQYWDHFNDDLWVNDDGVSAWELVGGAGGITGGGLANQVAYFTAPNVIAGDAGMTYAAGTDTLTVGNVIIATGGNILPADAAGQDLGDATHRWDTFASYVNLPDGGWIGIAGNELLTVNAAGTFAFSGIAGVTVEDGDWIGIGAAAERIEFYTAGYVSVMGARLGVGTQNPTHLVQISGTGGVFDLESDGAEVWMDFSPDGGTRAWAMGHDAGIVANGFFLYDSIAGKTPLKVYPANVDNTLVLKEGDIGINEVAPDRRQHTRETSASTNVIVPVARFESEVSGGAGAAGHGAGVEFCGETGNPGATTNQTMGIAAFTWKTATHASRLSQFEIRTWYVGNEILSGVVVAPTFASVDGNARGVGTVDWQGYRTAATQVASGAYAAILGGGSGTASGNYGTVAGGWSCLASGGYSHAAGYDAHATHANSFVLSATNAQTVSWAASTFTTRCHGGARFYSAGGTVTGVELTAGANAWGGISARAAKENFRSVEGILDKIAFLPIYNYNLRSQSEHIRHIGPVAEDFNEIFGFTEAPLRINMSDFAGVGLAGVQALHAEVVVLRERVRVLETYHR